MRNRHFHNGETPRAKKTLWLLFASFVLTAGLLYTACSDPTNPEPGPDIPARPTITSVASAYKSLTVTWGAVSGAAKYEVYYNPATNNPNGATKLAEEPEGTIVTITGLTNGTTYYVWVKAKNSAGISGFSQSGDGTPEALAPENLVAAGINGKLVVSWTAVPNATEYEVFVDTGETVPNNVTTTTPGTVFFAEIDAGNGTSYNAWVKAVYEEDKSEKSGPSARATGTPKAFVNPIADGYYYSGILPPYDDGIEISGNNLYYYANGKGDINFAGEIVENVQSSDASGVLIIKITNAGLWGKTVNAYYGLAYKNKTDSTFQESSATHPLDWTLPVNNGVSTIAEAVSTYTEAKGYYAYYGTYAFQEGSVVNMEKFEGAWSSAAAIEVFGTPYIVEITGKLYTASMDMEADGTEDVYFSGTILEATDTSSDTGDIYLRLINGENLGGEEGDYYAIRWDWDGNTLKLAEADGVSNAASLESAKTYLSFTDAYYEFERLPSLELGSLTGIWTNEDDDVVTITGSTFTYNFAGMFNQFTGFIKAVTDTAEDEGYIYIKFTQVYAGGDYDDCTVGNYYAIHWKNRDAGSVELCTAWVNGGEADMETLEGAKSEFTVENGYFDDGFYMTFEK
jgi:hypothetical protein